MKTTIITFALLTSSQIFAHEHALGAHEHGTIKLGMAVEKNIVDIDLDGPTESFISFEYLPKTEKEKKIFNDVKKLWEKKILELVSFDKKLNCKITEASFKQIIDEKETAEAQAKIKDANKKEEGVHSDVEAKAKITCAGNLAGTNVQVSLKKQFKNIKKLTVEVISSETKSVEITKPVQSFKI
ncbi:MAG: ZrgA family zinc uptake protein [Bacteriovorax sp.]